MDDFRIGTVCVATVARTRSGTPVTIVNVLTFRSLPILTAFDTQMIYYFLTALGLIALIVPGIIVSVMLWVAVPAVVLERAGARAALRRSRELTRGRLWKLFLLGLIIGLADLVVEYAIPGVMAANAVWIESILTAVLLVGTGLLQALSYFHLRDVEEGESKSVDVD